MAVRIMGDVFRLGLPMHRKVIMLALANYANDAGHCWPTQASLARDTSLSERRLRDHIHGLEADGWLSIVSVGNGRGRSTEYLLDVAKIAENASRNDPEEGDEKADVFDTKADAPSPFSQGKKADVLAQKADVPCIKADVLAQKADTPHLTNRHDPSGSTVRNRQGEPARLLTLSPPRDRGITPADVDRLQEEHPEVDVQAVADDYLNWRGSAKHRDKVRGLMNQIKSPAVAARFPRKRGFAREESFREMGDRFAREIAEEERQREASARRAGAAG